MQSTFILLLNDYWHIRILSGIVIILYLVCVGVPVPKYKAKAIAEALDQGTKKLQVEKGKLPSMTSNQR